MTLDSERLLRLFTSAPNAFWRHDVDVSLPAAERMARFAQLAGVQSTFYLMARGEHYNLFGQQGERTIGTILECGHRVGVHVDHRTGCPERAALRDLRLVDVAYPGVFKDRLVSFHMPRFSVLWRDFSPVFVNAYAPEWKGRYVADSRGEWTVEKERLVTDDMQVNLHPEHWWSA